MIGIDGLEWNVPCDIDRTAEMQASSISGMTTGGAYYNDVIGTFLTYDVTMAVPPSMQGAYESIYEALTDPVNTHTFVLPYGRRTIALKGIVDSVKDVYVQPVSGKSLWRGMTFTVRGSEPIKLPNVADQRARGLSPLPSVPNVREGTVFVATDGNWTVTELPDGELRRY